MDVFTLMCRIAKRAYVSFAVFATNRTPSLQAEQPQEQLLDRNFGVRKVVAECKFTEGPVVDAAGNLYFSDRPNDRIVKLTGDGKVSDFRQPCGRANGLAIDREGRLLICQSGGAGGGRRVTRLERTGEETVMASEFCGKPFNAPNDLTVGRQNRIYFTDPNFGDPKDVQQPVAGVYRIDAPKKGAASK